MKRFKSIFLLPIVASNLLATTVSCSKPEPDPSIRINLLTEKERSITEQYTSINPDTVFNFDFYFQLSQRYHHMDDYVTIRVENFQEHIDGRPISLTYRYRNYTYLKYEIGNLIGISHEQGLFYYPFSIVFDHYSGGDYGELVQPIYTYNFDLILEYVSTDGQYCSTNTFKGISITIDTGIEG